MGTWGNSITSNDTVSDVIGEYVDQLKAGSSSRKAYRYCRKKFSYLVRNREEGPLFWLAIGEAQWRYGSVEPKVLKQIRRDLAKGHGLELYETEKERQKRIRVLEKFIEKIEKPNPKPRKHPKLIIRPPIYKAGDCLSIALPEGYFGAALVLAEDHSLPELGLNTIATLRYYEQTIPTLDVFEERNWLFLTHGNWSDWGDRQDVNDFSYVGWRKEKHRFQVVGNIRIKTSDPKKGVAFSGYNLLGEQISLQLEWERKQKNES